MPPTRLSEPFDLSLATGARIHFGLLEINEQSPNCYGGIGLMVDQPEIRMESRIGESDLGKVIIDAPSAWHDRIRNVMEHWCSLFSPPPLVPTGATSCLENSSPRFGGVVPIQRIRLHYAEPAHQGLGSGTQISSLVAHTLWLAHRQSAMPGDRPVDLSKERLNKESFSIENEAAQAFPQHGFDDLTLQRISQRGVRSHVGLTGYLAGGLIIDPGKSISSIERESESAGTSSSKRSIARYPFPDWPVLLVQNPTFSGEHGQAEKEMFHICASKPNWNRERMLELIECELEPAIRLQDWHRWDRCIGEYGHLAGMIFRDVQSGIFRSQAIRHVVEKLHVLGCQGACQSSWGPTVAVVAKDLDHAESLRREIQSTFPGLIAQTTHARNCGVSVCQEN